MSQKELKKGARRSAPFGEGRREKKNKGFSFNSGEKIDFAHKIFYKE